MTTQPILARKEVKPTMTLRPFQRIGSAFLADRNRAAIFDVMGL